MRPYLGNPNHCSTMKRIIYILALFALGLTSCNTYFSPEPIEHQVYHFSIPASIGEDTKAVSFDNNGATPTCTSTFSTSEQIYVYNNRTGKLLDVTLKPTNLSNDGKNCDLIGDLTGNINDIKEGDELTLYYNAEFDEFDLYYYFGVQYGKASEVLDGAIATVTVSSIDSSVSTTGAYFSNIASIFRLKFEDEKDASPIEVQSLAICSKNSSLIDLYMPLADPSNRYRWNIITMYKISDSDSDYNYMSLFFDESRSNSSDALTFVAYDRTHLYRGTRTAPTAGFKNGQYYYNTASIQLKDMGELQTNINANPTDVEKDDDSHYYIITCNKIGLWGTNLGYCFNMKDQNSIVNLNTITAIKYEYPFIGNYCDDSTLELRITGTNTIDCRDSKYAAYANDYVVLTGNGTLTVTTNDSESCGFYSPYYTPDKNFNATTTVLDVSEQLTFNDYRVVRSARTDNPDGTYTWTYTVAPKDEYPASVTLNDVTQTDGKGFKYYAARDDQTITGSFSDDEGYITIADGATVTLNLSPQSDPSFFSAPSDCDHAPIHCLGDAHIILADASYNLVTAGSGSNYPAVFVPEGKTLTISGTGELVADARNSSGAGIGGGNGHNCGNIVIAGGVISAISGGDSAGIGSGSGSSCGNITVSGGAIKEATYIISAEAHFGAGIGSGSGGSCGTITISGGQIGGEIGNYTYGGAIADLASSIGCGSGGSCGTITIGTGITCVFVSRSNSHEAPNLIGASSASITPCDIYFGDFKVFDQTARKWYQGSSENYLDCLADGVYGGIEFSKSGDVWVMTPATP